MKWKSQSTDEVGEIHDPLVGFRSWNDLPFVRGLMIYYGLHFHDVAPNFVLNISAFIIVCEAFLRIKPHFGLWLRIFCVKPKIVSGQ